MKTEVRTNFKKRNNDTRRVKRSISTYVKKVHDLMEVEKEVESLSNIHMIIGACIGGKGITTLEELREEMIKTFLENQPDLTKGENMFWQIEASSSKCILKTSSNVSFGYKLKYKKNEDDTEEKFVIDKEEGIEFTVVLFRENTESEEKLFAAGYKKLTADK